MLDLPISPLLAMPDDQWVALCAVAIVAILAGAFRSVLIARAREQSRREIAAYMAEGSISPDQGERLMAAGNPKDCKA